MNAILGFSEVLKLEIFGPLSNARYQSYADDIYRSAGHLLALIDDILDLSKIEAGQFHLTFENVDLRENARVVTHELKQPMAEKSLRFRSDVDVNAAKTWADEKAIHQILSNLLSNAMKFTPTHGEITLTVHEADSNQIQIVVSDTGVGIPESDFEVVLSPFGQSGDMKVAREGGTGLGLPIVRSLSELHGGTLTIESEVGIGTKVVVTLPQRLA